MDGDSGTYLGAFGRTGLNNPQDLAVDQQNQKVWVGDSGLGLVSINYDTGQVLSQNLNYADISLTPDRTQVVASNED